MKIAYIILAHKYPEQLERLVSRLQTANTSFFIHIDGKTDRETTTQIVNQLQDIPSVYFVKRHKCFWGDFNIIKATLEAIKALFKSQVEFDYAILLSGQDYLIKSNSYLSDFLVKHQNQEFMEFCSLHSPENKWYKQGGYYQSLKRIEWWHFHYRSKHLCIQKERRFLPGIEPYGGSQWWCLSKNCLKYIQDFIEQNPAFVNYFKYTFIPDELFFQTLVLNSPFKDQVINDDLRYVDWDNPNPKAPATLLKDDFKKLKSSSKLFGRKFDMTRDEEILNLIDQQILKVDSKQFV
ncbi:MAG: beta-1,6-N-acetylglucosaminyltransferase [Coleofasciculaceae cyanobacterium]